MREVKERESKEGLVCSRKISFSKKCIFLKLKKDGKTNLSLFFTVILNRKELAGALKLFIEVGMEPTLVRGFHLGILQSFTELLNLGDLTESDEHTRLLYHGINCGRKKCFCTSLSSTLKCDRICSSNSYKFWHTYSWIYRDDNAISEIDVTTLSISNTQHNNALPLYWMSRFIYCYAECRDADIIERLRPNLPQHSKLTRRSTHCTWY